MCGRLTLTADAKELAKQFRVEISASFSKVVAPRYNIAPTQSVIVVGDDGQRHMKQMRWLSFPDKYAIVGSVPEHEKRECAKSRPPSSPDSAANARFWRKPWFPALAIVVLVVACYLPVWHAGFIWDDDDHLTANPAMTSLGGLRLIWSSLAVSRYYPLTLTSFWVQRRLWGLNPLPYHLLNVALHAVNGLLIFLVLRRLRVPAPWLSAMAWMLHPVNVESAAWITELKNTQSGFFFFLALLCFLRFEAQPERHWYARALLCGLAAMLSKPSTAVLPVVLLLCAWWQRGRWQRADLLRAAPFFGLGLGMSALTVAEQHGLIRTEGTTEWNLGMAERFIVAGKAVWFYAAKLLWPVNLTFVYPRWNIEAGEFLSWLPLAGLVAVGMILWLWHRQGWARAGLFGLGFFVVALLPVMGFFDVYYFRYSFVADHFQYLASAGFIALVVSAGTAISQRTGRLGRRLGAPVAGSVLLMLGACTWKQAHVYQNLETLWRDTLTKNADAWLAHNNVGCGLLQSGNATEAVAEFTAALRVKPDYAEAHFNLGVCLLRQRKVQEAIEQFKQALQTRPGYAAAHDSLGIALFGLGRVQEAIGHYKEALRIRPHYAEAHNNLGNALLQEGKITEAIEHYQEALRIKPDFVEAHNDLGTALFRLGNLEEAIRHFEEALRLKPDLELARQNLAAAHAALLRGGPKP